MEPILTEEPILTDRLSRRRALKTYVPPTVAMVSLATTRTYGTSGSTKKNKDKKVKQDTGGKKK